MITETSALLARTWRTTSIPDAPGMLRSATTMSGFKAARQGDRLRPVGGVADDVHAVVFELVAQSLAEEVMVVRKHDAWHLVTGFHTSEHKRNAPERGRRRLPTDSC